MFNSHSIRSAVRGTSLAILLILAAQAVLPGCAKEEELDPVPPPKIECPPGPQIGKTPPAAPRERAVSLGRSVRGEELKMYVLGEGGPVTFILGGIHGDEGVSAAVAQKFLDLLRRDPSLCRGRTVAILPRANPDGLAANTRVNAHGVDCNRNFPASNWDKSSAGRYNGGTAPGTEPETKAILKAVATLQPSRIISIHAISGGKQCNNWDGPAEDLARRMAAKNGYPAKGTIGYPTPGSMGSWAGIDKKIGMITLELPAARSEDECWRDNREALLEAIR